MYKTLTLALALMPLAIAQAQVEPAKPLMFPFVMPWDDASKNVVDVSSLNPAPLTEKQRVRVKGNHFYDQTGRRVKFLGANFTFGANFPSKEDAEKVAARMHKLGFNAVRLHHMDGPKAPSGIWDPNFKDLQHIDAGQLDKLDYLVAQLSKNGIYVDLNLHVARKFGPGDGFPDTDKLAHNGKITAWFEPRMIDIQKKYAQDLLTHKNPYTGYTWAQDPAVALIEIHNEDTLVGAARDGSLQELPAFYRDQVVKGWNNFLRNRYGTTVRMVKAWNAGLPPAGENLIRNGRFETGSEKWTLEKHEPAQGAIEVEEVAGEGRRPDGKALKLTTTAITDQSWHLQLNYNGLNLEKDKQYTVNFWAKAAKPRRLTVYTKMDQAPWEDAGLRESVGLSTGWKRYSLTFKARDPLANHSRLTFVMGDAVGDVWISDVEMRSDGAFELPEGESLEAGNVDLLTPSDLPWGLDFTGFLMGVEADYVGDMKEFIQKTLGSRAPVTCSQANFGGMSGVWREAQTDFVDTHAYWQHPRFPGTAWDPFNWNIQNRAMVADERYGTLPGLATYRVADKPFTVTEYNHPAPNDYSAETIPMIMAYAAWQDWDGVFIFEYATGNNLFPMDKIKGFFTSDSHPGKMAFMPAAARMYLGEDPSGPATSATLEVPQQNITLLSALYGGMPELWRSQGYVNQDAVGKSLAISLSDKASQPALKVVERKSKRKQTSSLEWTVKDATTGSTFSYQSPGTRIAVLFDDQNRQPNLKGWSFKPVASGRPFVALALSSMDGKPVERSNSLLFTAEGNVENQDMGWNEDRTSVGVKWGRGPTVAEGIGGQVSLPTRAKSAQVFALDGTGARRGEVPSEVKDGHLSFEIGPQFKTLWYEIAVRQ